MIAIAVSKAHSTTVCRNVKIFCWGAWTELTILIWCWRKGKQTLLLVWGEGHRDGRSHFHMQKPLSTCSCMDDASNIAIRTCPVNVGHSPAIGSIEHEEMWNEEGTDIWNPGHAAESTHYLELCWCHRRPPAPHCYINWLMLKFMMRTTRRKITRILA